MTTAGLLAAIQTKVPVIRELPSVPGQFRSQELHINVPPEHIATLSTALREDPALSFEVLRFMTSVDWKNYFELVYLVESIAHRQKLVMKVHISERERPSVPSVSNIWLAAEWQEREIFDLMGIRFKGHRDLRRILLPEEWVGHPLRKDYVPVLDQYD